jgi:DTW domain-containing protein
MRSRTEADLPGRCPRCYLVQRYCLCAALEPIDNRIEVVLLRHRMEGFKSTNTGRIAALALKRCIVIEYEVPGPEIDERLRPYLEAAWLLFPKADGSAVDPSGVPARLVVVDGTWRQARRMVKRLPEVAALPSFSLPELSPSSAPRLRHSPHPNNVSTMEAIGAALGHLENSAYEAALRSLYASYAERVFKGRGKKLEDADEA